MTPYGEIYKAFLAEVQDDLYVSDGSPEREETIVADLTALLNKAVVRFSYPRVDLRKKDDELQEFEEELTLEEIEILATGMVVAWANREVYNIDVVRQTMTTKDFNAYSKAPHLNALVRVGQQAEKRFKRMLIKYSIRNNDSTSRLDRLGQ
jgi:hypothetical protein